MVNALQLVQGLSNVPEILQETSTIFSQSGEDVVVDILLSRETEKGMFVDIGAYHPFRFSNTMLLYLKGWRGVNVDGNPHTIELFNKYRGDEINIHALVSDTAEDMEFFRFQEGAWNTTDAEGAKELAARGRPETTIVETLKLKTTPIQSILEQHVGNKKFDFLNIDVEGMDMRIFFAIDFDKYRPKVICLETPMEDWLKEPLKTFIKSRGYRLRSHCMHTAILLREE